MDTPVRILHLEDNRTDSELLREILDGAGVRCELLLAQTRREYVAWLEQNGFDVIVSDYTLPSFDGDAALLLAKEKCPDIPFIFFSGTIGEENAVDALISGATDYVLKNHPKRLPAAIRRALLEAAQRRNGRAAARALAESEERFRQIAENIRDVLFIAEPGGDRIFYVNSAYESIWGRPPESLSTDPLAWRKSIHPEDRSRIESLLRESRQGFDAEFRIVRPDGRIRWVRSRSFPVMGADGKLQRVAGIAQDMTQQKQSEAALQQTELQLRQAQKMDAVGRLAGGVAHDFNNLLTAILGYANLLQASMDPDDVRIGDIKEITASANRAAGLTKQLLAFSRRQVLSPKILDINSVIRNMEKMLQRIIGEDIKITLSLDPGLRRTRADAGQMEQVIMNLAVNSRDAMPTGGKLTLETKNVNLDERSPGRHDIMPAGAYVMVAVSDTGGGMDEETKAHLFEPFFTTKAQGKGTGLGLSTIYGIVKQSGGYIWVCSEPGKGSTFKTFLPATEDLPEPAGPEPAEVSDLRGSETVLLVEDDESVGRLLCRVLRENGYSVLESKSGAEAFILHEQRLQDVDLLVTDVVMPGMGGRLLGERLKEIRPDVKILYISGYTDDAIIRHGTLGPGTILLQKPLAPQLLLTKVRHILDGAPNGA